MSKYERFTLDVGAIVITNLLVTVKGLVLLPIIAKHLGPYGYGIWAQVLVTLGLLSPILEMGLTTSLVRFLAAEKDRKIIRESFSLVLVTILGSGLAIALILASLSPFIARPLFGDTEARAILFAVAALLPFEGVNLACQGFFLAFRRMRSYSLLVLGQNFGELVLVAGLVLSGFGVLGIVFSLLIIRVLTGGLALYMVLSEIGIGAPTFARLKEYIKFGLPLVPTNFFGWLTAASNRYIIGFFLGVTSVGIYSAASNISNFLAQFRVPLARVLPPTLSKSYDEGKIGEVQTYLRYSLRYFLMLAIPSAVGLSLLSKQVLQLFTRGEFVSSGYLVMPFIAASAIFSGFYALTATQVLVLAKKTGLLTIILGIAGVMNLSLNLAFVPTFGLVASAAITLFSYVLAAGIGLYFSFRELTLRIDWAFIIKSLASSGVMSLVVLTLKPEQLSAVLLTVVLGAITYGISLFLLRGFEERETRFFLGLLRRNSRRIIYRLQNLR